MKGMISYKPREISSMIENNGWIYKRSNGSHRIYSKSGCNTNIVIPFGGKEVSLPMAKRLLKEAGVVF
jgi:predicted RNA binding protein YcfA (HicA-like mRNA interferase family)